ncbi:hypothetical protein M8J77_022931 [Diaphorina citri]|nr:hypothetical protein M8J77_022931 [Diaphorina citri]
MFILMTTFLKNIDRFKDRTFQSYLLCCIPEHQLEKRFTCALVEWLLENHLDQTCETKCLILIKWLNCKSLKFSITTDKIIVS